MSWLKLGLIGLIIFVLYAFQQIKMTLKEKGYEVGVLTGWLTDYRRFKELTEREKDDLQRAQYQSTLNSLYLALAGLVVIAYFLLFGA